VRGVWRRADEVVTAEIWGRASRAERDAIAAEAAGLPLPGVDGGVTVRYAG
jgi:hypothetical protein